MFQAQSNYFHRLLSPTSRSKLVCYDLTKIDIQVDNECLTHALKAMKEKGLSIPCVKIMGVDDIATEFVLNFCQTGFAKLDFAPPPKLDRLDCLMAILDASIDYEVVLLRRMVQIQMIADLQGANHQAVKRIEKSAPWAAAILIEWCSERLSQTSQDADEKTSVLT